MRANRIKEIRLRANLTLRELSKLVHIDYSYLSKLEKGTKKLTDETALKLADFFSTDKQFIEGNDIYTITCFTSDLSSSLHLHNYDIKRYGVCYDLKFCDQKFINVIKRNVEEKIIEDKLEINKQLKKLISEKEMVDSMDNWALISLMYAKEKIDYLLNKKR